MVKEIACKRGLGVASDLDHLMLALWVPGSGSLPIYLAPFELGEPFPGFRGLGA